MVSRSSSGGVAGAGEGGEVGEGTGGRASSSGKSSSSGTTATMVMRGWGASSGAGTWTGWRGVLGALFARLLRRPNIWGGASQGRFLNLS